MDWLSKKLSEESEDSTRESILSISTVAGNRGSEIGHDIGRSQTKSGLGTYLNRSTTEDQSVLSSRVAEHKRTLTEHEQRSLSLTETCSFSVYQSSLLLEKKCSSIELHVEPDPKIETAHQTCANLVAATCKSNLETLSSQNIKHLFRSHPVAKLCGFPFHRLAKRNVLLYRNKFFKFKGSADSSHHPVKSGWIHSSQEQKDQLSRKCPTKMWLIAPVIMVNEFVFSLRSEPQGNLSFRYLYHSPKIVPQTQNLVLEGRQDPRSVISHTVLNPVHQNPVSPTTVPKALFEKSKFSHPLPGRSVFLVENYKFHNAEGDELFNHPDNLCRSFESRLVSTVSKKVLLTQPLTKEPLKRMVNSLLKNEDCAYRMHLTQYNRRVSTVVKLGVVDVPSPGSEGGYATSFTVIDYRTRSWISILPSQLTCVNCFEVVGNRLIIVGEFDSYFEEEESLSEGEGCGSSEDQDNCTLGVPEHSEASKPTFKHGQSELLAKIRGSNEVYSHILIYEFKYEKKRSGSTAKWELSPKLIFSKKIVISSKRVYSEALCRMSVVSSPTTKVLIFPRTMCGSYWEYDYWENKITARQLGGSPVLTVAEEVLPNDQVLCLDTVRRQILLSQKSKAKQVLRELKLLRY